MGELHSSLAHVCGPGVTHTHRLGRLGRRVRGGGYQPCQECLATVLLSHLEGEKRLDCIFLAICFSADKEC